ncbi:MAG: filamentous hemagglutinin N-terminal domain-containing protein [Waterburya sp.]
MKRRFSLSWFFAICLATSLLPSNSASAQVTSDGTTGTVVDANGNSFEINAGTRSGDNLFHSFEEFSVPNGGEAVFNNAVDISNILSRVTGGEISNIDGLIEAQGGANLFLINPAGIIFGQGASLSIGGSFYGSTADSIVFEDGEFSAVNNLNQPILTINAPIGLNLRDNPNGIAVNGNNNGTEPADFSALSVLEDQSLYLIGGNIELNNATLSALEGNITLGGLQTSGTVDINENGNLNFPENLARGNISLDNSSVSLGFGSNNGEGGTINLNGNNIELLNNSMLMNSIDANSGSTEAQAGNINLNATETINLSGRSVIRNLVESGSEGNSGNLEPGAISNGGNVDITTANLSIDNGASISAGTLGEGDGGDVTINATESITLDGTTPDGQFRSVITSQVESGATGNGGNVDITTANLSIDNGAFISAGTLGEGDGGNVLINATDSITLDGTTPDGQFRSVIASQVESGAIANGGNIDVTTANLSIDNGAFISAGTLGEGDGGDVTINATELITLDGTTPDGQFRSVIASQVESGAIGNGGNVDITTANLSLDNGAFISASTLGEGDGGNVLINAEKLITLNGRTPDGQFPSVIASEVNQEAIGNGGSVEITTANLSLDNGAAISTSTVGEGNGGDLTFNIGDRLTLEENSDISAEVIGTNANGGDITINAENGFVVAFPNQNEGNGSDFITRSPEGKGGNIEMNAQGVLGLEEGNANLANNINNIDASGTVDGVVKINTPNSDAIEGTTQLPNNPVEAGETVTQACVSGQGVDGNNLIVSGKGGIPRQPIEPLVADSIYVNGQTIQSTSPQPEAIKPIKTSKGDIIPAQGVDITKDGRVILTAYPTSNNSRTPKTSTNCGKS